MVFVGDYIYEGAGRAGDVRRHVGGETRTLADYRNRHAQYKTDRVPAAPARRGAVAGDVGRPRGRQQLRGHARRGARPELPHATRSRLSGLLRAHAAAQAGAPDALRRRLARPPRLRAAGALPRAGRSPAPNAAGLPGARPRRREDHRRALPGAARPGADDARRHAGAMAGAGDGDDRRALELPRSADADGTRRRHGRRPQALLVGSMGRVSRGTRPAVRRDHLERARELRRAQR